MSREDWGWIGTHDALWHKWQEQAGCYPFQGEQEEVIMRFGLVERLRPVYDTCSEMVGTEDVLGYCFMRLHEDSSLALMLGKGLKAAGKKPADIRNATDLGAGAMRYIMAVDSVFPNMEECQLIENDPERIAGARERIAEWGVQKGKYRIVDVSFQDYPRDKRVLGNQDLIFLRNPNLAKDPVWQDQDAVDGLFAACAGKLKPDGVFLYAGRLRELAPWFGIGAKHGTEFETIPFLKQVLGVEPLVETSATLGSLTPFATTNFIVMPMNAEQTRTFGRLMSHRV